MSYTLDGFESYSQTFDKKFEGVFKPLISYEKAVACFEQIKQQFTKFN